MDNLTRIEEERRKGNSPYKTIATIAAVLAIFEFFEVWSLGWTLLTFLVPEWFGMSLNTTISEESKEISSCQKSSNSSQYTDLSEEFKCVSLREDFGYCVIALLVFHLLYLFSAGALIWSNKNNWATAFPVFIIASVGSLLLTVSITIYFCAESTITAIRRNRRKPKIQSHKYPQYFKRTSLKNMEEMMFTYLFEPNNTRALAHFLIFLYFSRYFFVGWIVKLAIVMCVQKRKEEILNEKESIEIQTAVDKAFKNVFDPEPDEPHVRPEAIPESMRRIPRVTAAIATSRKEPDDVVPRNQPANGYLNRAYERESEERSTRQDARSNQPTSREPRYPREAEDRGPRSTSPKAENRDAHLTRDDRRRDDGWKEPPSKDADKEFLQARDRRDNGAPRGGRGDQEYPLQEYSRRGRSTENLSGRPQSRAAEDGDDYRSRESRYQMHGVGSRSEYRPPSASDDVYRPEPAQDYEARSRSPPHGQYMGDKRHEYYARAGDEQQHRAAYGELRRRQADAGDKKSGGGGDQMARQDESRRTDKPRQSEYDDVRHRADRQASPTDRGGWDDDYEARGRLKQQQQHANDSRRPVRREPEHDDYGQREARPQQRTSAGSPRPLYEDYEARRSGSRRPAEDYGRERSSTPPQPLDASRYLRPEDGEMRVKKRPASAYYSRDSGLFDYGPGPLGYNVPSPHSRPRSMVMGYDDDDVRPGSTNLKREESFVQKILPRYESTTGGALRTGPAPVGGVPAVGPASLRRSQPRLQ